MKLMIEVGVCWIPPFFFPLFEVMELWLKCLICRGAYPWSVALRARAQLMALQESQTTHTAPLQIQRPSA